MTLGPIADGWTINPRSLSIVFAKRCPPRMVPPEWDYEFVVFAWRGVTVAGLTVGSITIPIWFLIVAFPAYPSIAFIRGPLRRWRRRKRGECVNCGYNLTGNVTGVCSECGMKIVT